MEYSALDNKRACCRLLLCITATMLAGYIVLPYLLPGELFLRSLVLTVALELLVFLLPAALFAYKRGDPRAFGVRFPGLPVLLWSVFLGIGGCVLMMGINAVMQAFWLMVGIEMPNSTTMLEIAGDPRWMAVFLMIVLVPAVAEETLFRGAMLHALAPKSRTAAIVHSALLFALFHINPFSLPAYIVLGLLLGTLTIVSGSVFPAMVVHGVNNLIVMAISYAGSGGFADEAEAMLPASAFLLSGIFYMLLGLAILYPAYRACKRAAAQREARQRLLYPTQQQTWNRAVFLQLDNAEKPGTGHLDMAYLDMAYPDAGRPDEAHPDVMPPDAHGKPMPFFGTGRTALLLAYVLLVAANAAILLWI